MEPTLVPASTLPYERLAFLVNQAYIDYYIPIWLNETQFMHMCRIDSMDLDRSAIAMVEDEAVGLALLSIRGKEGWVSAVGVLPTWRRQGIASEIIKHLQNTAQTMGLQVLRLEVLAQNQPGSTLYKNLGFVWQRDLLVLTIETGRYSLPEYPAAVEKTTPAILFKHYTKFHDVLPPWQRSHASLQNRREDLQGLGLWDAGQLVGYLLYSVKRKNCTIHDIAVDPDYAQRIQAAKSLLQAVHHTHPDMMGHLINFPAEDPLLPALTGLHYRIWQRQHELVWSITPEQ